MTISRTQMRTQLTGDRMPAKSEKQRRYMAMAYNDPEMGVSKEVAKKFMKKPAKGYKKGGMPDLTGDGKVTQADVLKGRGVFKKGGKVKKYQAGMSVDMDELGKKRPKKRPMKRRSAAPMTSPRPMKRPNATSPRPKLRPETIGGMPGGSTRGIDPKENYSPEDFKRLTGGMMAGGKVKKMKSGGKIRGYGMARGGKACKMR